MGTAIPARTIGNYGLVAAAFGATFFSTVLWMVHTWFSQRGAHGPVIAAISLYMIWSRRDQLRRLTAEPKELWGSLVLTLGCMMLLAGKLSSLLLLQDVPFIVVLLGLVLLLGGVAYLGVLGLPIAYLVFSFPLFSELLEGLSIHLQSATAWVAWLLIKATGIPVLRSGQFLELQSSSLEVARECNGINHMVALVGLAIPLASWTQRTAVRKTVLVLASGFIALFANGMRVAVIGILSHVRPDAPLHGPSDIFYVTFVFFFGMVLLVLVSRVMGWRSAKEGELQAPEPDNGDSSPAAAGASPVRSFVIAVAVLTATSGYLYFFSPSPVNLERPLSSLPSVIGRWVGHDADLSEPPFDEFTADLELRRTYRDDRNNEVRLYLGYFPLQTDEKKVVGFRFDPLQRGASVVSLPLETGSVNIKQTTVSMGSRTERVYFYYDINGRIMVDRYAAKLATLFEALVHQRTNAAIVVLSFPEKMTVRTEDERSVLELTAQILPVIRKYLEN
jgi:EpsI family protein